MRTRNAGPDENLRDLERRARAGDDEALVELDRAVEAARGRRADTSHLHRAQIATLHGRALVIVNTGGHSFYVTNDPMAEQWPDGTPAPTGRPQWRIEGLGPTFFSVTYDIDAEDDIRISDVQPPIVTRPEERHRAGRVRDTSSREWRWVTRWLTPRVQRWVRENQREFEVAAAREANEKARKASAKVRELRADLAKAETELVRALRDELALGSPLTAPRVEPRAPRKGRRTGGWDILFRSGAWESEARPDDAFVEVVGASTEGRDESKLVAPGEWPANLIRAFRSCFGAFDIDEATDEHGATSEMRILPGQFATLEDVANAMGAGFTKDRWVDIDAADQEPDKLWATLVLAREQR